MPQAAKADSTAAPGSQTFSGSHTHDIALVNLWRCEGRLRALALMFGAYLADKEDKMVADALADLVEVEADSIRNAADHICDAIKGRSFNFDFSEEERRFNRYSADEQDAKAVSVRFNKLAFLELQRASSRYNRSVPNMVKIIVNHWLIHEGWLATDDITSRLTAKLTGGRTDAQ